jgi:protein SCO1/2
MRNNKFPLFKILILVTILAVPGFLYYLLQAKGKNRYKPLPVFGPKIVASTFKTKRGVKIPDTIYHQIKNVKLVNVLGDTLKFDDIKKQLIVVNFFYSRNQSPLKEMNLRLQGLNEEYKDNSIIRFISISVDPDFDNTQVLAKYALNIGAKPNKWDILVADSSVVYPLAKQQFFVNALRNNSNKEDFIFSNQFILLDADHRIRGYYTGTSSDEVKKMSDEMKVLITEELRKIKAEF